MFEAASQWSNRLKVIALIFMLALLVEFGQMLYWVFVSNQFYPKVTLQGIFTLGGLLMHGFLICCLMQGKKRAFIVFSLVCCVADSAILNYFIWRSFFAISDNVIFWLLFSKKYYIRWNSLLLLLNIAIVYQLLRYETKLFVK